MAITLGFVIHLDRAPAAAIPPVVPVAQPVIDVRPLGATVRPVTGACGGVRGHHRMPFSPREGNVYRADGRLAPRPDASGLRLDIFA